MIVGIGSDMIDIRRIEKVLRLHGERFTKRVFTDIERQTADARITRAASYAKRFAAKEACAKALGSGIASGVSWQDMGVVNLKSGKPTLTLAGGAARSLAALLSVLPSPKEKRQPHIHLTMTDDFPWAQAFVIIEAV